MFQTSHPVSGQSFHDRAAEMEKLVELAKALVAGAGKWLALIGPRKIGKTSMILELGRRVHDVAVIAVDTQEVSPPSIEIFRTCALRVVDSFLGAEFGESLEVRIAMGGDGQSLLDRSETFATLPASLKTSIRGLANQPLTDDFARVCLDLPERLAEALGRWLVIAIDEFQELASAPKRAADALPLIRSVWQRHRRVAYIVSGSGRSMLKGLITEKHSPFFQHFDVMYVEAFPTDEAVAMLVSEGPAGHRIPDEVARSAVSVLGGHPFYLQLLGETLTAGPPPFDEAAFKEALQEVLFSRTGRLALYFQILYERAVGRSTYLASTLEALSAGPMRLADVARAIGVSAGDTARYLERLGDVVRKHEDGRYAIDDPVLPLWLRWRQPGGTIVPMAIVGDEAEREVASVLSRMGFDLVYQSRASRGAFDLLATRGGAQLGIQVKRSPLPLRFDSTQWQRMVADSKRFGWRWIVANVERKGEIHFLDPSRAQRGKTIRLSEGSVIDNLIEWTDGKPPPSPPSTRRRHRTGR